MDRLLVSRAPKATLIYLYPPVRIWEMLTEFGLVTGDLPPVGTGAREGTIELSIFITAR
jgi:hypothetical protein